MLNGNHVFAKQIFAGIFLAAFGAAIGYCVSLSTVVNKVSTNGTEIDYLKKADIQFHIDLVEERKRTDERIFQVASTIRESLVLNRELVALVKVQNELLTRERKGN
jgi:hypothetical protein